MAFWMRMQLAEGCNHHRLAITRHSFSSRMNNCWIATAASAHNSSTSIQRLINIITQCTTFHNENNQNTRGTGQAGWIVSAAFALYNLIKFVYTRVYYKLYLFSVFHFVVYSCDSQSLLSTDLEATQSFARWQLFCSIFYVLNKRNNNHSTCLCECNACMGFAVFFSFYFYFLCMWVFIWGILHGFCCLPSSVSSCLFASLHDILFDTQIVKIIYDIFSSRSTLFCSLFYALRLVGFSFWFYVILVQSFFSFVFRYYLQQLHILRIVFQFFRCIYTSVHSLVTIGAADLSVFQRVFYFMYFFSLLLRARGIFILFFLPCVIFCFIFFFNINRDKSPQILTLNNQTKTKANPKCLLNQKRTYRSAKCTNIAIFIHKLYTKQYNRSSSSAHSAHRTHPNKQFATNFLMWLDF